MPWSKGPLSRFSKLRNLIESKGLDAAVISGKKEIYYFTGFLSGRLILPTYLFYREGKEPVLFTGSTEKSLAEKTFGGEVVTYDNYRLDSRMVAYPGFAASEAKILIKEYMTNAKRIGADSWNLPHSLFLSMKSVLNDFRVIDISDDILEMRTIKDPDELDLIRTSCALNDHGYALAKLLSVPGKREVDVYSEVHQELCKKVGTFQYSAGDFVSGERSLYIGGPPTDKALRTGETFIIDLWVIYKEYWSDTCRTFVIGGSPTDKQAKIHSVVMKALENGMSMLRPGVSGSEIYRAVYNTFKDAGYGEFFPHHAGHGIGLDGQEPPFFIPGSKDVLRPNMTVTLEPGLYVPEIGGGIRLENNFIVTPDGPVVLTKYPLDL